MHWSRSQNGKTLLSHDNLNFYFSACALRIFFAGNLLEEEFRFDKNENITNMLPAALLLLVPVVLYHCTCIHTWFIM